LRKLLAYPMPPVKCLSLAGTQPIFKTQFRHLREAHCLLICAPPFFADRTDALPFTDTAGKFVWHGPRHNPLAFGFPGSRTGKPARPVRDRSSHTPTSSLEPPLWSVTRSFSEPVRLA
jgi:hypothetical protein